MHPDAAIEARGRKGARRGRTEGGGRGDGGRIRRRKTIRRHDVLELKLKLLTGQDIMFIFFSSSVWPPTFPNVPILGLCERNLASSIPKRPDLVCFYSSSMWPPTFPNVQICSASPKSVAIISLHAPNLTWVPHLAEEIPQLTRGPNPHADWAPSAVAVAGVLVGLAPGPPSTNTPEHPGVLGATLQGPTQGVPLSGQSLLGLVLGLRSALQCGPQHSRTPRSVGRGWPQGQSYQHARDGYYRRRLDLSGVLKASSGGGSSR